MSASVPVPDPNAEMADFHRSVGADGAAPPPAAEPEPVADPAPAAEPPPRTWEDEIIDRPELPPSLRGISVRDYIEKTSRLAAEVNQAGFQKNEALARAQVAEATARLLHERLQGAQPQPAARQPQPHETFGLRNREDVYNEGVLPDVVDRIPDVIDQRVNARVNEILENEIRPVREQLVKERMERAQTAARSAAGIKEEAQWEAIRPALASYIYANNMNPELPATWTHAIDQHRQSATWLVPQQVTVTPGAPPAGNGRPGAAPPAGVKKAATTGDRHLDAAIQEHVRVWRTRGEEISAEDIINSMRQDRAMGELE